MNILQHLQHLDTLIVKNTKPPVTAKLRNYLSTIIEQAETEGDLPAAMAKLKRETQEKISRLTEEYSEGKGILIPPAILAEMKKKEGKKELLTSRCTGRLSPSGYPGRFSFGC